MSDCPNDPSNGYGSHNTTHTLPCLATGCGCYTLPEPRWVWAGTGPRPYEDAWSAEQMRDFRAGGVAAERVRIDMLRDALAALVDVAGTLPDDDAGRLWHRLEDARQALAQAGGSTAPGPAP